MIYFKIKCVSLAFLADMLDRTPWSFAHTLFVVDLFHKLYKAIYLDHKPSGNSEMTLVFPWHWRDLEWSSHHHGWIFLELNEVF